ncbi:MAG: SMI1/KNR4 family protein [Kibdelosporangium sp.]
MTTLEDTSVERWREFLGRVASSWSDVPSWDDQPPDPTAQLGAPGLTIDDLAELERRLGSTLPPSYRAFLRTTDGWRRLGHLGGPLLPAKLVGWVRDVTPLLVSAWQDGLSGYARNLPQGEPDSPELSDEDGPGPGLEQNSLALHPGHLPGLLQIGRFEEVTYLLNPAVRTPEGEWEAWALGAVYAGARRFPSFEKMAEYEYEHDHVLFPDKAEEAASALAGLPHPASFAHGSEMWAGQTLRRQSLTSPSGVHTLVHQDDGELVLYRYSDGHPEWTSGTRGTLPGFLMLQDDGDLVLRDTDHVVMWHSGTAGQAADRLLVDDSGELRLVDSTGSVLWTTR